MNTHRVSKLRLSDHVILEREFIVYEECKRWITESK